MVRWPGVIALVFVLAVGTVAVLGTPAGADGVEQRHDTSVAEPEAAQFDAQAGAADTAGTELLAAPDEFVRTTHKLTVYDNGSVRWTDRHTRPLENESEEDAYETYAAEFNAEETELYTQFRETASQLTERGTETTGRQMNASSFERWAHVAETGESGFTLGTQGVVEMSFTWSNFTERSGQQLRIGDIFTNGLSLGPNRRLVIVTSGELQFIEVEPAPDSMSRSNLTDSQTITWTGEREFSPYRPLIRLGPASTGTATTTATTSTTTTDTPGGAGGDSGPSMWLPIGAVVLVVTGGAGGIWYLLQRSSGPPTEPAKPDTSAETESAPLEPEAVLSDADRVEALLEDRGGRMRQSEIVEETDWSKSKVSMLLSDMEDDGEITKLRVGRENIVSLPGHEPDAAGSPFEDEE
ncbi:DUF7343 domain-containing protein [Halapricum hydrolyticum]|uniref:HTH iclR-type domain-containing protein n=1 Tax=Halapricum hydrolyticum TaxID=2979991 RepID=A0AAE3LKG7_9EURY|nr:hypothetical protein [Halapricum hydrolyticum]MCU4719224.1 hypothetical protein [Halapricum hydrolyticum]MCU4728343.1 hypothetical protein [Halapricum hydrolyticum]